METVLNDLASRYCPLDKALFLGRSGAIFILVAAMAAALLWFAKYKARNPRRRELAYIGAGAVAVVAIGSATLVLVGLSGCGAGTEAGLTWDWPW